MAQLSGQNAGGEERIAIGTMHLVKGLEFKAVVVMACDEAVIPSAERLAERPPPVLVIANEAWRSRAARWKPAAHPEPK